jgi:hypothetical protein
VLLSLSGLSLHRIAFLLHVSAQSVLNWIRAFAREHEQKPEPTGRIIILERDAMWHYRKKERCQLWMWKAREQETGQLLAWECGRREKAPLQKMVDGLIQWAVTIYWLDDWAPYASVIPQDKLRTG